MTHRPAQPFTRQLPHPRSEGVVQVVDLEAAAHAWETSPGVVTHGHAFNGQVPGPTIEAVIGDTLAIRFTNLLPEPAAILWDPRQTRERAEEVLAYPVQPGASVEYRLTLTAAGTFCYHIPQSGRIGHGLHGVLIVRNPGDPPP